MHRILKILTAHPLHARFRRHWGKSCLYYCSDIHKTLHSLPRFHLATLSLNRIAQTEQAHACGFIFSLSNITRSCLVVNLQLLYPYIHILSLYQNENVHTLPPHLKITFQNRNQISPLFFTNTIKEKSVKVLGGEI